MYVDGNTSSGDAKALLSMGWRVLLQKRNLEEQVSVGRPISEAGQGREIGCEYRMSLVWTEHKVCSHAVMGGATVGRFLKMLYKHAKETWAS